MFQANDMFYLVCVAHESEWRVSKNIDLLLLFWLDDDDCRR